jgi:hypothetical protein
MPLFLKPSGSAPPFLLWGIEASGVKTTKNPNDMVLFELIDAAAQAGRVSVDAEIRPDVEPSFVVRLVVVERIAIGPDEAMKGYVGIAHAVHVDRHFCFFLAPSRSGPGHQRLSGCVGARRPGDNVRATRKPRTLRRPSAR